MELPSNWRIPPSILELKGETLHQLTTGTSGIPGRRDADTRSKYSNGSTVVGEAGHLVVDVGSTNNVDQFDTGRGDRIDIDVIVTNYKGFIYQQVREVVRNDVPEATTCMPMEISCKRSGDVGKIDQELIHPE